MRRGPGVLVLVLAVALGQAGTGAAAEEDLCLLSGYPNSREQGSGIQEELNRSKALGYKPAEFQTEPEPEKAKKKKTKFFYKTEDTTRHATVRSSNVNMGVDYRLGERRSVEVQAGRKFYDGQDAKAWNRSPEEEDTAHVKYKVAF